MSDDELIEAIARAMQTVCEQHGEPCYKQLQSQYPISLGRLHEEASAALAVVRAHDRDGERLDWLEQNPRHENVPYFDESEGGWGFPYAISNANGLGGGIGFHRFDSLRAAIGAAMRAEG